MSLAVQSRVAAGVGSFINIQSITRSQQYPFVPMYTPYLDNINSQLQHTRLFMLTIISGNRTNFSRALSQNQYTTKHSLYPTLSPQHLAELRSSRELLSLSPRDLHRHHRPCVTRLPAITTANPHTQQERPNQPTAHFSLSFTPSIYYSSSSPLIAGPICAA